MIKLNGIEVKPTIFPDGTSQVWKLDESLFIDKSWIEWEFESESEFMHLAQLKMLLDGNRVEDVSLYIPFLPYGRQDKNVANDATFALETFGELIQKLDFYQVTTLDAHSERAGWYGISNVTPSEEINGFIGESECDLICFPDFGAKARYSDMIREPYIYCDKTRDQLTGYIKEIIIKGECKGKDVLIVDDICDGGMTFILTAKKLLTLGAKSVSLYTTHGIYSKGTQVLFDAGISKIYDKNGEVK